MRLTFKWFNGRFRDHSYVIDQDTGQTVGIITSGGVGFEKMGGIDVRLFDGRYTATFNRMAECYGFVKGVEAVLNHMVRLPIPAVSRDTNAA